MAHVKILYSQMAQLASASVNNETVNEPVNLKEVAEGISDVTKKVVSQVEANLVAISVREKLRREKALINDEYENKKEELRALGRKDEDIEAVERERVKSVEELETKYALEGADLQENGLASQLIDKKVRK